MPQVSTQCKVLKLSPGSHVSIPLLHFLNLIYAHTIN